MVSRRKEKQRLCDWIPSNIWEQEARPCVGALASTARRSNRPRPPREKTPRHGRRTVSPAKVVNGHSCPPSEVRPPPRRLGPLIGFGITPMTKRRPAATLQSPRHGQTARSVQQGFDPKKLYPNDHPRPRASSSESKDGSQDKKASSSFRVSTGGTEIEPVWTGSRGKAELELEPVTEADSFNRCPYTKFTGLEKSRPDQRDSADSQPSSKNLI